MTITLPAEDLQVINIGLESFAQDLRAQGVAVVHLDWRPPAGGNAHLAALLASLDDDDED
jgi:FdrA protein